MSAKRKLSDKFSADPGSCNCANVCNRRERRGACPCLARGAFCSTFCTCGTKKISCTNRPGKQGSVLSEELGLDPSGDRSEEEDTVELAVSFVEDDEEEAVIQKVSVPADLDDSLQSVLEQKVSRKQKPRKGRKAQKTTTAVNSRFSDKLSDISREELLQFVDAAVGRHPDLQSLLPTNASPFTPPPPRDPEDELPWCHCGRCRPMPQPEEQLCCRRTTGACLLETAGRTIREVALDRNVLTVAIRHMNDLFAHDVQPNNKTFRLAAYRQFVLWRFKKLGSGNRVVIPSCIVTTIRSCYPSDDGTYTGFKVSRFN